MNSPVPRAPAHNGMAFFTQPRIAPARGICRRAGGASRTNRAGHLYPHVSPRPCSLRAHPPIYSSLASQVNSNTVEQNKLRKGIMADIISPMQRTGVVYDVDAMGGDVDDETYELYVIVAQRARCIPCVAMPREPRVV